MAWKNLGLIMGRRYIRNQILLIFFQLKENAKSLKLQGLLSSFPLASWLYGICRRCPSLQLFFFLDNMTV
jgi:hypothetical protein